MHAPRHSSANQLNLRGLCMQTCNTHHFTSIARRAHCRVRMAVETCFRMSTATVASTAPTTTAAAGTTAAKAAWPFHGRRRNAFSSKDKLSLLANAGHRSSVAPLMSSVSSVGGDRRRGLVVCQAKKTIDEVLTAGEANWDTLVTKSEKPVLVEFWAPWCGPCRVIAPVLAEMAKEYAGKVVCCQVNTDDSPTIASKFGIRSIPTVLVFRNGEKKDSVIGAVPKSTLVDLIDKHLA